MGRHNDLEASLRANVPPELAGIPRWLAWRYGRTGPNGKRKKEPICARRGSPRRGKVCDLTRPQNWATFEEALELAREERLDGAGFVVAELDDIVYADLDNCVDPDSLDVSPWARRIVEHFGGAYVEVSPSATGLRLFFRGSIPDGFVQGKRGDVEVFSDKHYASATGRSLGGPGTLVDRQVPLERLLAENGFRRNPEARERRNGDGENGRSVGSSRAVDTDAIVAHVEGTKLGEALFVRGDRSGYHSPSEADMALMGLIARFAGDNAGDDADRERTIGLMARAFRRSALGGGLARKSDPEDYLRRTARTALGNRSTYAPARRDDDPQEKRSEICDRLVDVATSKAWKGASGPTDWSVFCAVVEKGRQGRIVGKYLLVSVAVRPLALLSGISSPYCVSASIERLREKHGMLRKVGRRNGRFAQQYAIPLPDTSATHKEEHGGVGGCVSQYVPLLCRFRKPSASGDTGGEKPLRRLGKSHALVLAKVVCAGGSTLDDLARATGKRANSLKSRYLADLLKEELIELRGGTYRAPEDLGERIRGEFEKTGVPKTERLQRERYERERRGWDAQHAEWRFGPPPPSEAEARKAALDDLRAQGEAEHAADPGYE